LNIDRNFQRSSKEESLNWTFPHKKFDFSPEKVDEKAAIEVTTRKRHLACSSGSKYMNYSKVSLFRSRSHPSKITSGGGRNSVDKPPEDEAASLPAAAKLRFREYEGNRNGDYDGRQRRSQRKRHDGCHLIYGIA
jgi:hypothetical protein